MNKKHAPHAPPARHHGSQVSLSSLIPTRLLSGCPARMMRWTTTASPVIRAAPSTGSPSIAKLVYPRAGRSDKAADLFFSVPPSLTAPCRPPYLFCFLFSKSGHYATRSASHLQWHQTMVPLDCCSRNIWPEMPMIQNQTC